MQFVIADKINSTVPLCNVGSSADFKIYVESRKLTLLKIDMQQKVS